jgi:hypothetical protein
MSSGMHFYEKEAEVSALLSAICGPLVARLSVLCQPTSGAVMGAVNSQHK